MCKKILLIFFFVFWALSALADMIVDTAWVRRYSGPNYSDDWVNAIAVDDSNNVYVTGDSYVGSNSSDYVTIKYYPNGDTAWLRRYNGLGCDYDNAVAIAVDDSEYVYVTGTSVQNGVYPYNYDYVTIKYLPNGDTVWIRKYNGRGNSEDRASAIAIDGINNVYVTGFSYDSAMSYDYVTIKYYPNGDTAWVRRYNGPIEFWDKAHAIAIDGCGNAYVTGGSYGSGTSNDYATIKYDPNGNTVWVRRYNGSGNNWDEALVIAIDDFNNVFVTGSSVGSTTSYDYTTIEYDSSGNQLWVSRYNGHGNSTDEALAMAIDGSGNVYVTGITWSDSSYFDYATIKYHPNGDTAWVRIYSGPVNESDVATAIAVDSYKNVYVTGYTVGNGTSCDYTTIKYYPNGDSSWVRRYNGPANSYDFAYTMALSRLNHIYIAGGSQGISTGTYDFATINYVQYLRGDVTGDWLIDLNDVVYLIGYLYVNGETPDLQDSGNVNCDELINLEDVVYLINYVLKGGPEPSC